MKKLSVLSLLLVSFLLFSQHVSAQSKQRVHFIKGASGATLRGIITGYAYRDYIVSANAGQQFSLKLTSKTSNSVVTVLLPNGDNLDGAMETTDFSGELPASGNYVIRVLMMRSEARRKGSMSNYTLNISIK